MVATAYMDEAQRFDWLMAMDDGKIIADGTLKELLDKTGEPTLDEAFIALMPEEKRALHQKVIVRPRVASADEVPAIEAEGLTRRFGDFVAVDHVSFKIAPRRNLRLPRLQRLRQIDHDEDVDRVPARDGGLGEALRQPDGLERHGDAPQRRLHDAGVLALRRTHRPAKSRSARSALSLAAGQGRRPHPGAFETLRSGKRRQRQTREPAARHQAAASACGGGAARAGHSHPRRADFGRRSDRARRVLAHTDRSLPRRRRHDLPFNPLHE